MQPSDGLFGEGKLPLSCAVCCDSPPAHEWCARVAVRPCWHRLEDRTLRRSYPAARVRSTISQPSLQPQNLCHQLQVNLRRDKFCERLNKMLRSTDIEQLMHPPAPLQRAAEHSPYLCFCIPLCVRESM